MAKRSMMWMALLLVVVGFVPALAQDAPQAGGVCCVPPNGGPAQHYAMLGRCPSGWTQVPLAECGVAEPTPVPTVAPTEVPTPEPGFEPKEIKVPKLAETVIGYLINKFGKAVVIPASAAIGVILVWLTGLIRQIIPRLKGKAAYLATCALTLLGVVTSVLVDGTIAPDEWWSVLVAVLGVLAAIPGYKLVFSTKALRRVGK